MKLKHSDLKNADTKTEKLLLAFLEKKAEQIDYGKLTLEITIQDGRVSFFKGIREEETITISPKNE